MSTTTILVTFNNQVYNQTIPNSSHLATTAPLSIERTKEGFILRCKDRSAYTFTFQTDELLSSRCIITPPNSCPNRKNFVLNDDTEDTTLASLKATLDKNKRWLILTPTLTISKLMYGVAVTISGLIVYCIATIGQLSSVDYEHFSKRELKILATASALITILAAIFVNDTRKTNAQTSLQIVHKLVTFVLLTEDPNLEENASPYNDLSDDVSKLSQAFDRLQSDFQEVKKGLLFLMERPPNENTSPTESEPTHTTEVLQDIREEHAEFENQQAAYEKQIESISDENTPPLQPQRATPSPSPPSQSTTPKPSELLQAEILSQALSKEELEIFQQNKLFHQQLVQANAVPSRKLLVEIQQSIQQKLALKNQQQATSTPSKPATPNTEEPLRTEVLSQIPPQTPSSIHQQQETLRRAQAQDRNVSSLINSLPAQLFESLTKQLLQPPPPATTPLSSPSNGNRSAAKPHIKL